MGKGSKPARSQGRPYAKLGAVCLLIGTLCLLLEAGSWVDLAILTKSLSPHAAVRARRDMVAVSAEATPDKPNALESWEEVPNPFFGAGYPVYDETNHRTDGQQESLSQYGFKDDAGLVYKERVPERFVINVTGGSVARVFMDMGGGDVLKAELLKLPFFRGKEIVFSSTAFYGHKQPQQFFAAAYMMVMGAKFDMIINIDGFNELTMGKIFNHGVSPYYPFKWHERMSMKFPDAKIHAMRGVVYTLEQRRKSLAVFFRKPFLDRTMAGSLLWYTLDHRLEGELSRAQYELSVNAPVDDISDLLDTGPMPSYADDNAYLQDMVHVWHDAVLSYARFAQGNDMRFITVLQPNQYFGRHTITSEERQNAWNEDTDTTRLVRSGYPLLQKSGKELRAQGVNFYDATGIFDAVKDSVYTDDCCHFNREAPNALFAKKIAGYVADAMKKESVR